MCISDKFPGDAEAAGLEVAHCAEPPGEEAQKNRDDRMFPQ